MTTQHDERAELMRHKPTVQSIMDLARKFRSAPGDLYDAAYKELEAATYAALLAADAQAGGEAVARVEVMNTGGNAGSATRIVEIYDPHRDALRPGTLLYTQPQAVAQGWKPIETAPKDGTVILVTDTFTYRSDPEKKPHHVYRAVRWNEEGYGWEIYNDGEIIDQDGPTFWMPLPAEPGAMLSASPASPAAAQVAQPLTELVRNLVKAYTDEAREVLDETYRFATQSPRGQQNINAVFQLLDDIDAAIAPVEAAHGIGKDQANEPHP